MLETRSHSINVYSSSISITNQVDSISLAVRGAINAISSNTELVLLGPQRNAML